MKHLNLFILCALSFVLFTACGADKPTPNPKPNSNSDTSGVSSQPSPSPQTAEKKDLLGFWMDKGTYDNLKTEKSYTKNLAPSGFHIEDDKGTYLLMPFTIEADVMMPLSEEAEELGYKFNGQAGSGYYAAESYLKLVAKDQVTMTQVKNGEKTVNDYVPFQEPSFLIMGGKYKLTGAGGKELGTAEFKDKNKLSFDGENYVYYDLVTDTEKDLLLLSTVDAQDVDFAVFLESLTTYVIEVTPSGFELYENKTFEKSTFDIIHADGYPEVQKAEKGGLFYRLNK